MPVNYQKLPFDESIEFFRQKINLPTARWTDIWQGMHARAFVVAGATRQELLADFRTAIDKAIADGTTLAEFRKDFDRIVQSHGWSYKGGRGWRSRVIYETNVRQAYNAGRERQMRDPDFRRRNPYALYRHGDSAQPRPLHLAWDGLVLPIDDPWWDTHTPMNGWGCKCKKFVLSERQLKRLGKDGPDPAPDDGTYEWTDKQSGEIHRVPNGIDPGFAYNVGEAAWGRELSREAMDRWKAAGHGAWETLTPGDWQQFGRSARIPLDPPRAGLGVHAKDAAEMTTVLRGILGGEEKLFRPAGAPVLVNAESLAAHIDPARSPFLPFIEETLNDPFEVWLTFQRHQGTGKVVLRQRIIKAIDVEGGKGVMSVLNAVRGLLEAWTFIPMSQVKQLNNARRGWLLYGRE